jgi:hypothetical protein
MVFIVEEVEILGLGFEMPIVPKPLGAEESSIIGIIEALHGSVPPRFSDRDKDRFYPQKQTESEDDPKGARVAIAPPEAKFVVELKKVGHSHGFPTADQPQSRRVVVFSSLGMKKNSVAVEIDDIERIEPPIALDISRPDEVCLMDMVAPQRLGEIMVFHPLGGIGSFF